MTNGRSNNVAGLAVNDGEERRRRRSVLYAVEKFARHVTFGGLSALHSKLNVYARLPDSSLVIPYVISFQIGQVTANLNPERPTLGASVHF